MCRKYSVTQYNSLRTDGVLKIKQAHMQTCADTHTPPHVWLWAQCHSDTTVNANLFHEAEGYLFWVCVHMSQVSMAVSMSDTILIVATCIMHLSTDGPLLWYNGRSTNKH